MTGFLTPAVQSWPSVAPVYNGQALDQLREPLQFVTNTGEMITIPAGYTSDGGSIPWWGRWLVNPANNQRAWWLHDWAWDNGRDDHADLLNQALIADDCPKFHRFLIVFAVANNKRKRV
jgi:hypothetical protein